MYNITIHQFIKIKGDVSGVCFFSRQSYATRHRLPSLPTSHQKKKGLPSCVYGDRPLARRFSRDCLPVQEGA